MQSNAPIDTGAALWHRSKGHCNGAALWYAKDIYLLFDVFPFHLISLSVVFGCIALAHGAQNILGEKSSE